jgi:hypothetical protein
LSILDSFFGFLLRHAKRISVIVALGSLLGWVLFLIPAVRGDQQLSFAIILIAMSAIASMWAVSAVYDNPRNVIWGIICPWWVPFAWVWVVFKIIRPATFGDAVTLTGAALAALVVACMCWMYTSTRYHTSRITK